MIGEMQPGHYRLELEEIGTRANKLFFTVPLDEGGRLDTESDLPYAARWDGHEYAGTLVLEGPWHHELHWDPDVVRYEPYLTDLFTAPITAGAIITVWEGNLPSCVRRLFRVIRLARAVTP